MPDPNDPTAGQIPPEDLGPFEAPQTEAEIPNADPDPFAGLVDPRTEDPADPAMDRTQTPPLPVGEDRSQIQGAMEDALDRALATGDTGYLRTYPISPKMRARLANEFIYHTPRADQIPRYGALRSLALTFATMVIELTPPSREQSLALTKIGEAVMHANAAIARGEADPEEGRTPDPEESANPPEPPTATEPANPG